MAQGYDKVTQASMNSLYVKAQELDRGHNENDAPATLPPGMTAGAKADATSHASDAQTHASSYAPDSESRASTHISDDETRASYE